MRSPRKISIADASKNGHTWPTILCMTERATPKKRAGDLNWCGHKVEMHVTEAIAKWGAGTSLSELPIYCSVCGGRNYEARVDWPPGKSAGG